MKLYFEQLDEDASGQLHPVPQDYKIQALKTFKRDAKRLQLTKEDLSELEQELKSRAPKAHLGNSIFKFEWYPSRYNQGKKEARVIYIELTNDKVAWLVNIYKKNEKSDITPKELKQLAIISKELRGR